MRLIKSVDPAPRFIAQSLMPARAEHVGDGGGARCDFPYAPLIRIFSSFTELMNTSTSGPR